MHAARQVWREDLVWKIPLVSGAACYLARVFEWTPVAVLTGPGQGLVAAGLAVLAVGGGGCARATVAFSCCVLFTQTQVLGEGW